MSSAGVAGLYSLAGRVRAPLDVALPVRVGGFGGVSGLVQFVQDNWITHVVDATHPFAAQMSRNACAACDATNTPLIALTRAPWVQTTTENWQTVPDVDAAVHALSGSPRRVFLAVGRQHLAEFGARPQHYYLLRTVDPLNKAPFASCETVVARGPFTADGDAALMRKHQIDLVVSKNAGGSGAEAKIIAARNLGVPVLMIDRPQLPHRRETHSIDEVMRWLGHGAADLGV